MKTSRLPGFYKQSIQERLNKLDDMYHFTDSEWGTLTATGALPANTVNHLVENAIGTYPLPLGIASNFLINGKDYIVPMAIEEPSVIASASHIAKIVRQSGGFQTEATERIMIGQIQVVGCPNVQAAQKTIFEHTEQLLGEANASRPSMLRRNGGAKSIEVRLLDSMEGTPYGHMLIVHLYVDTCDAMGANTINTMVEAIAPTVERLTCGKIYLRILSNYTDRCLAASRCCIPVSLLGTGDFSGEQVRDGVIAAHQFAARDMYRAVTHNKGVMNGVDAVVIATGNDWRAIEAAAHAHASRFGHYGPMTDWTIDGDGNLVGSIELPMPVGTAGGSIGIHPTARLSQKLLNVESASELAQVVVTVGLAQNLGALKALATDGIQKGHMALQAKSIALAAGAQDDLVDVVAKELVQSNSIQVDNAKFVIEKMSDRGAAHAGR